MACIPTNQTFIILISIFSHLSHRIWIHLSDASSCLFPVVMRVFTKLVFFLNFSYLIMQQVEWGNVNMIEAERRLLANALLDFSNQRFVLLSESCIPLFNFSTVYSYLINSSQSFVESYDLDGPFGRGRYKRRMRPQVTIIQWRKGAQWFEMDRDLGIEVVSDQIYFPVFQKHCKGACYADEHYLPTLVIMKFGQKNSNRTLTWVDWSKGGRHPAHFLRTEVTIEFLERLRSGSQCQYNGNTTNMSLVCQKVLAQFFVQVVKVWTRAHAVP